MNKNIFILGNGFDLDLGMKTRYSDFANSEDWPENEDFHIPPLKTFLEERRDIETWFDMENEVLNYIIKADLDNKPRNRYNLSALRNNLLYFQYLHKSLATYIDKQQQTYSMNQGSIAGKVLKAIYQNGYFKSIYSFNYTDLNLIAQRLNIPEHLNYTHIHGSIAENSIILGVDETVLPKGYESFHKTMSEHYRTHRIFDDLLEAQEIVFLGISFGKIDYTYFDRFFQTQSDRVPKSEKDRKHITIFTYDEQSRSEILNRLNEMGINRQHLYTQSNFSIIRTAEDKDTKLFEEFRSRLDKNSRAVNRRKLEDLTSFIGH